MSEPLPKSTDLPLLARFSSPIVALLCAASAMSAEAPAGVGVVLASAAPASARRVRVVMVLREKREVPGSVMSAAPLRMPTLYTWGKCVFTVAAPMRSSWPICLLVL